MRVAEGSSGLPLSLSEGDSQSWLQGLGGIDTGTGGRTCSAVTVPFYVHPSSPRTKVHPHESRKGTLRVIRRLVTVA